MLIAMGASLLAVKGYAAAEVQQTYLRAQHLCQHLDNPQQLFPVLRGLCSYHIVRAELRTAHALSEQLLTLAQQVHDAAMLCAAHRALGTTLFDLGAAAEALTHYTQGLALYDLQQHRAYTLLYGEDTGVLCHSFAAVALWCLGYPEQGLTRSHEAVTLARQIAHPFSLALALSFAAVFHQLRREEHGTQAWAEAVISLAQEQGFPLYRARGAVQRGWTLVHQGQAREGIEEMHQGLRAFHATGAEINQPSCLALLAEAHGTMGQPEAGLAVLAEALTRAETTGERWYEAEIHRLRGALLLQQTADHQAEAETCFQKALEVARNQQAKSWELRATTSLAHLWQQQGKRQEAHDLLALVYNWFTEGFDTADLQEAKALLEALAG
jgi:predicted ATPase